MSGLITTFFIPLVIYLFSASQVASGYADSDELITMAHLFGVTHPSGYPMAVTITGIFMRLFFWLSPAQAANLLAGVIQATAMYLLYRIIKLLFSQPPLKAKLAHVPLHSDHIAAFITLVVAFSPMFWLYGSVIEVVSFTNLLVLLGVFFALRWFIAATAGNFSRKDFYVTWIIAGLGLAHIHTYILVLPGMLLLLLTGLRHFSSKTLRQNITLAGQGILAAGIAFILPLALMFGFNYHRPTASWHFPPTIKGLYDFVSRQDYTGFFIEENKSRQTYVDVINSRFFTSQPHFIRFLIEHFTIVITILTLVGLVALFRYRRSLWWALLTWILISGPIFIGVISIPDPLDGQADTLLSIGVLQRQLFIAELFLMMAAAVGLVIFLGYFFRVTRVRYSTQYLIILAAVFLSFHVSQGFQVGFQRDNTLVSDYIQTMLKQAAPESTIICSGDTSCFGLLHASLVEKAQPDVTILTKNPFYRRWYLDANPHLYPYLYQENPDFYASLISWQTSQNPTYITLPNSFYTEYIGLDGTVLHMKPQGLLFQITPDYTGELEPQTSSNMFTNLANAHYPRADYFKRGLLQYFSGVYNLEGLLTNQWQASSTAKIILEQAVTLDPANQLAFQWLQFLEQGQLPAGPEVAQYSYAELISDAQVAYDQQDLQTAFNLLRKATYVEPGNPLPHLKLAQIFADAGYPDRANREALQVLVFDPQNATASGLLSGQL